MRPRGREALFRSLAGDELDGALAGQEVVVEHAAGGDHGKAAVLQLDKLAAGKGVRVLGAVKGVKAEVTGLAIATLEHLNDCDEAEKLHSALLHGGIVEGGHLGITENGLHARELGDILDKHASGGKHAHAAVLELGLAKPPNVDEAADAEGIEANITSPGAVEGRGERALEAVPANVLGSHTRALLNAIVVQLHLGTIGGSPLGSTREHRGGGKGRRRGGGNHEQDSPEHFCYPH